MTKNNENLKIPGEEKRKMLFGVEVAYISLLSIAIAFLGWLLENSFRLFRNGVVDSRFNILPFIAPYMLLPFLFHIIFGDANHIRIFKCFQKSDRKTVILSNVVSYLLLCLGVFVLEFIIGNMWDVFFGVTLWNYSKLPLNFTKFTSPITTFGFGFFAYVLLKFVMPPALRFLRSKVSFKTAKWVSLILGTLIILDTVRMGAFIIFTGEAPHLWRWDTNTGVFTWLP